jgi:TatD DNase family protein
MRLVDVHCHLESDFFKDRLDDIIRGARDAGIVKLITSSITPGEWPLSESIARRYPEVEFALGVHPWYAKEEDIKAIPALREAPSRGAVAIGEIGLDKKTDHVPFDLQQTVFEAQLSAAKEARLPVIIHCRGAFEDLIRSVKKIGLCERGGVVHSFSGSPEIAAEFMKWNLHFSFGGALTFRNSRKKESVLRSVYPDFFMLETDSPDIPPVEARDMPNVPSNIVYNLRAASEILGISEAEIAATSSANAKRMFNLEF